MPYSNSLYILNGQSSPISIMHGEWPRLRAQAINGKVSKSVNHGYGRVATKMEMEAIDFKGLQVSSF